MTAKATLVKAEAVTVRRHSQATYYRLPATLKTRWRMIFSLGPAGKEEFKSTGACPHSEASSRARGISAGS